MAPHRLHAGMSINDRMLPLLTNQVQSPDIALSFDTGTPNELFNRALSDGAFDITEMSLATHAILTSRGANPFVGLPVFTSRMFRHGSIFVSSCSDISNPSDLKGRRVGVPEYQMTAAVWMRGILQDDFGLLPRDVEWVTGGVNKTGRSERIALQAPKNVLITKADTTLNAMLLDGALDAIIAPQTPDAFLQGDKRVRRLFENSPQIEVDYFAATQIFPIMHLLVVRRSVLLQHPELALKLFDLFDAARRHAISTLKDTDAPFVMLPWQAEAAAQTRALMGDNYWPYGIADNAHVLDTFLRYLQTQELLDRAVTIDELFAPCFANA